jgi:cytochrome c5
MVGLEAARKLWFVAALAACGSSPPAAVDPLPYLDDASYRRSELSQSLVNPANGYSELRLAHYATGDANDWDRLPEWNPPAEPIAVADLDAPGGAAGIPASAAASPLALPASVTSIDDPALLALGKAAFSRYPTQPASYFAVALASPQAAAQYGVWVDAAQGVGGLVRARAADASTVVSLTCATCHTAAGPGGALVPGLPNAALDVGAALLASEGAPPGPSQDPIAAWGPGRLDVTTTAGTEPARIPDLRPVRWLTYLQQDATVRARDITALAIRIETLITTSNDEVVRPPRVVALGLAVYVTSLAGGLPSVDAATAASPQGAALFQWGCATCHASEGMTGAPVALSVIGTDPVLGMSASRGTGTYRVPSLHGVGSRGPLLHDGTLPSVDAMFDPARLTASFTGRLHGTGPVEGHASGLDLAASDRAALVAFLQAL